MAAIHPPPRLLGGPHDSPSSQDDVNTRLELELAEFIAHRAVIEQAKGILMHLLAVDADHAFAILSRYSQTHNVKLRNLAEWLVASATAGATPPTAGSSGLVLRLLTELATGAHSVSA